MLASLPLPPKLQTPSTGPRRLTSAQIQERLNRDHEISQLLDQIQKQASGLIAIYRDEDGHRSREIQQIGAGDAFDEFYRRVEEIKEHHARYPNEQAENSELRYKPRDPGDATDLGPSMVDLMFSGEEAFGRFFDLHTSHESYINLPGVKRVTYLQYLDAFDNFTPGFGGLKKADKLSDQYFKYVGDLGSYLESFMRRTRPLENLDKVFASFDAEFEEAWNKDEVENWQDEKAPSTSAAPQLSSPDAVWCDACMKEFKNENVYKGHLSGRKHIKAAEQRAAASSETADGQNGTSPTVRLKERAVASREDRVQRLAKAMSTERDDTRVNCERRQGMTERERQQELENLFSTPAEVVQGQDADDDEEESREDKIANPLKLPLAWDGHPIPFWLYRLHGLGQELPCEICECPPLHTYTHARGALLTRSPTGGKFVYMGRRAFEKHFNEARHIYGLKCLGITGNTALFRDITSM